MQVSYNWLKSFLPDLGLSPVELSRLLNERSFEMEIIGTIALDANIKVVQITALNPHPHADRLRLATIIDGATEITVVCGAPNIQVGDVVPYAPPGSRVLDENGQPFALRVATIRGIESPGMLTSPRELGLGPSHTGIFILPSDSPLGTSLRQHLPDDTLFEADVTPNRAHDCMGHLGIAQEIAALLNLSLASINVPTLPETQLPDWRVQIEDASHCSWYWGALLENITITASPLWLQARLLSAGIRPINNVVDCSNYVMLETGHPTHAFDADRLPGRDITIRFARPHEIITTLDDVARSLTPQNLVITSADTPVAIAGVMGGKDTEVTSSTKRLFLEVAHFSGYTIQQSAAELKLHTDSSLRFRREVPPATIPAAAARFVQLLSETAHTDFIGAVSHHVETHSSRVIKFRPAQVTAIAGAKYSLAETKTALERLRCTVTHASDDIWSVTPPVDRLDLILENDLVEEVIRLYGFDRISAITPVTPHPVSLPTPLLWEETMRDLAANFGATEAFNYSFGDTQFNSLVKYPESNTPRVKIANPPTPQQTYLRTELLPQLLAGLLVNKAVLRQKTSSPERSLFEIGSVFAAQDSGRVPGITETKHFGLVAAGASANLDYLRSLLDQIFQIMGLTGVAFTEDSHANHEFWSTDARLLIFSGENIGFIGSLSSRSLVSQKLQQPVACLELNLSALIPHATLSPDYTPVLDHNAVQYEAPSKYPAVFRDLSLQTNGHISADTIQATIERLGGTNLKDTELFDTYQDSFSFHLTFVAHDHTLTDTEADQLLRVISDGLSKELDLEIR